MKISPAALVLRLATPNSYLMALALVLLFRDKLLTAVNKTALGPGALSINRISLACVAPAEEATAVNPAWAIAPA